MALTKCTECGGQVSSLASACPACGAPPKPTRRARLVVLALGAFIFLVLFRFGILINDERVRNEALARDAEAKSGGQ